MFWKKVTEKAEREGRNSAKTEGTQAKGERTTEIQKMTMVSYDNKLRTKVNRKSERKSVNSEKREVT